MQRNENFWTIQFEETAEILEVMHALDAGMKAVGPTASTEALMEHLGALYAAELTPEG